MSNNLNMRSSIVLIKLNYKLTFSAPSSGKPYLSTLSPQELENLGLKAVAAGAEPTKLQQVNPDPTS